MEYERAQVGGLSEAPIVTVLPGCVFCESSRKRDHSRSILIPEVAIWVRSNSSAGLTSEDQLKENLTRGQRYYFALFGFIYFSVIWDCIENESVGLTPIYLTQGKNHSPEDFRTLPKITRKIPNMAEYSLRLAEDLSNSPDAKNTALSLGSMELLVN